MSKSIPESKKIDPESKTYRLRAISLAFSFVPPISPCAKCGNPVIQGYCCTFCKTDDPEST